MLIDFVLVSRTPCLIQPLQLQLLLNPLPPLLRLLLLQELLDIGCHLPLLPLLLSLPGQLFAGYRLIRLVALGNPQQLGKTQAGVHPQKATESVREEAVADHSRSKEEEQIEEV